MSDASTHPRLPAVDRILSWPSVAPLLAEHGRTAVLASVRELLAAFRQEARQDGSDVQIFSEPVLSLQLSGRLARDHAARLKRVFNLTGTVLHTNLGRAPLPEEAVEALISAARFPCALEYDLDSGDAATATIWWKLGCAN